MNSQANGSVVGSGSGSSGSSRSSKRSRAAKRSSSGWLLDKGAKLLIWYTLITAIFRCPSKQADLTDTTPKVCKPYLQGRDYLTPHAKPYYNQYLAPHVQKAQPYVDTLNQRVYTPGLAAYQQHGAPRVAQAQKVGTEQWAKTVKPQLEVARQHAGKQYDAVLAPYVNKGYDAINPHLQSLKTSASDIWELEVQPVYKRTAPYAQKFFTQGREFAVTTALPQAQYAGNAAWSFWVRQIWPKLRVLYGENVEPQLMRITERLGRYRDEKKLEADVKSVETSIQATTATSSIAATVSSVASAASEAVKGTSSTSSVAASSTPSVEPREQFLTDLKSWEQVCVKAVEEGSEHLTERIDEITSHQAKSQVNGTGKALVTQLEETADGVINSVKARILSIVGGIPEEASDESFEDANLALAQGIRNAGQTVKGRAQAVREWHQSYNKQTGELIDKALQSTLETIDNIRELRLAEIGRKYASSGLTHKDWSKYNDLKKATQAWRNDVEKVAQDHASIAASKEAAEDLESRGMNVAENVAKELARLKDVGKWKIAARDATDDFNTRAVPAAAEKARAKVAEKVGAASEAVVGSSSTQGSVESASSIAAEKASQASEAILGSSTGSVESASSVAAKKVSQASEAVIGSSTGSIQSASSVAAEKVSQASEAVIGSSTGSVESIASKASKAAVADQKPIIESVSSKVASSASSASEAVVGTSTGSAESFASKASKAVVGSEQPAVESVTSKVAASASSVASDASSAVVGESSLSDTLSDAASSISSAVVGTETPATQSIASSISSKMADKPLSQSSLGPKAASALAAAQSKKNTAASSASSVASDGSSSVSSAASVVSDHASDYINEASASISSASSVASSGASTASAKASSKVWGGAMAQDVPDNGGPILEGLVDDVSDAAATASDKVKSVADA